MGRHAQSVVHCFANRLSVLQQRQQRVNDQGVTPQIMASGSDGNPAIDDKIRVLFICLGALLPPDCGSQASSAEYLHGCWLVFPSVQAQA